MPILSIRFDTMRCRRACARRAYCARAQCAARRYYAMRRFFFFSRAMLLYLAAFAAIDVLMPPFRAVLLLFRFCYAKDNGYAMLFSLCCCCCHTERLLRFHGIHTCLMLPLMLCAEHMLPLMFFAHAYADICRCC